MKWISIVALSAAAYATSSDAQAHIRCQPTIGGPCGDSSRPRDFNCCDYGYCQPWNSGYYQCLTKPAKCPTQETDIDYVGNDLKTVYGLSPDKCCDECAKTAGCTVYTFVNENPDGKTACYLKKSAAGRVEKKGAVSGVVSTTTPPPSNCPVEEKGVDYYGNDIKMVVNIDQGQCCNQCSNTLACVAYTWIEASASCYLKSSTAGKVAKAGAVSGQLKGPVTSTPPTTPPPPTNCPVQEKDVDYYGNDISNLKGVTQTECCDACGKTAKCVAYSFVAKSDDGKSACYLKSSAAGKVAKAGVVSGKVKDPVTTPPPPTNCPVQEKDVDYYGNDLKTLNGVSQSDCCDACGKTDQCVAYTFVPATSTCYLKASTAGKVAKAGVVSGNIKYIPTPKNCPTQELNIDYEGNDIKNVKGVTYGGCCDACAATFGCRAFTYVEQNPDGKSACYLKSAAVKKLSKPGAIAGLYACPTPAFGQCSGPGTSTFCCPYDYICHPWSGVLSQCIPPPNKSKCPTVVSGVDFYGGDIEVKFGLLPGACCDACFDNKDCHLFTFINDSGNGKSACYLKSKLVEQRPKLGAFSGYKVKA